MRAIRLRTTYALFGQADITLTDTGWKTSNADLKRILDAFYPIPAESTPNIPDPLLALAKQAEGHMGIEIVQPVPVEEPVPGRVY